MTVTEIRNSIPKMVIWMANRAIMEACRSARKDEASNPNPYNREGVSVAAEVLFSMFGTCSASIKIALLAVAKSHDGFRGGHHIYFDAFVEALKDHDGIVKLRQPDWVLES
jgi:hypothetical protein